MLDEELPVPLNTGKRIRTMNLLSRLSRDFEIHLLVHGRRFDPAAGQECREAGLKVIASNSEVPPKRGMAFGVRLLRNLLTSRLPYSVESHFRREFARHLRALRRDVEFDLVHCEWTPYASYVAGERLPVCIAAHNVEAQIWERMASECSGLKRWFLGLQADRMRRFEETAWRRAAAVVSVSVPDAQQISQMGARRVSVVPNGVDFEAYSGFDGERSRVVARGATQLVFTGSMDWRPNQEGIQWFIAEVAPLLDKALEYHLTVVGRNPPRGLIAAAGECGSVSLTGTVDDVRPYIAGSDLYVVPLRSGGGSRLKILEAAAMARPILSTSVGAEGLELEAGRHLRLADSAREFAKAIRELSASSREASMLARSGAQRVRELYDWGSIAPRQADVWGGLVQGES